MKINREELYKLYMQHVEEICDDCDWKTQFGPEEIVNIIAQLLEDNPHLVVVNRAPRFSANILSTPKWPEVGSKLQFKAVHTLWFSNIIKDAEELLVVGQIYTIAKISPASSWCSVVLEEFPDKKFALSFFTQILDKE